ncbi:MAG: thiol reductant ABC exporter subunit CydC, partial [Acetobacteraceae bacterium]|nr:thiol reductant ABC exporter subunit CydC [Acetobacteraceae bacterium]
MTADLFRVLRLWLGRSGWLVAGIIVTVLSALAGVALLAFAGKLVAASVGGVESAALAAAGVVALLWLRPLILLRPIMRYLERLATHEATFRALADMRVWFFGRLAQRLPTGLGLRRAGDLLGRLVADVEALDGLYLRALVPAAASIAVVAAIALILGAAEPWLAVWVALPLTAALLLPLLLAPGAARAAEASSRAQGGLRAATIDPLTGLEDTLAANGESRALARVAEEDRALSTAQRALARRAAWGGAAGA